MIFLVCHVSIKSSASCPIQTDLLYIWVGQDSEKYGRILIQLLKGKNMQNHVDKLNKDPT